MSVALSVRLGDEVAVAMDSYTQVTGSTKAALVNTALEEWLRWQDHPTIRFVTTPTGHRTPALAGGPEVWTVVESWLQHDLADRTTSNVAAATGLSLSEVCAALDYYADYPADIDGELTRLHQAQDLALATWERRRALHD